MNSLRDVHESVIESVATFMPCFVWIVALVLFSACMCGMVYAAWYLVAR